MCWGNVQRTNRSSFYTCMHASIHTHVRTRRYTYPYLCMHIHACTCIYIQIHTCTYTAHMQYTYTANIQTYIQTLCISKYKFNPLWLQLFSWQSFFAYKRIHLPYELKPRQEQSDPFGQQVQGMPSQEGLDLCGHAYQNSMMWEQNNETRRRSPVLDVWKLKSYIQSGPSRIICERHMLFDRMESSVQAPLGTRRALEWNTNL